MGDEKGACQTVNKNQDDKAEEKKINPLDEDDIALLKTYVSARAGRSTTALFA